MNARFIISILLVGFAFYAYSMENTDSHTLIKQGRLDAVRALIEKEYPHVIGIDSTLPTLAPAQLPLLTTRERVFIEERKKALQILTEIAKQDIEKIEYSRIDFLYHCLMNAIERATEIDEVSVITAATLKEKMDTIRERKPIPFTATDLKEKEKEIRTHDAGKKNMRLKAERPPLPPHSWRELHRRMVSSASSAYCGPEKSKKLAICEIPEQEEQE